MNPNRPCAIPGGTSCKSDPLIGNWRRRRRAGTKAVLKNSYPFPPETRTQPCLDWEARSKPNASLGLRFLTNKDRIENSPEAPVKEDSHAL